MSEQGWTCPSCTFLNHSALQECELCSTLRLSTLSPSSTSSLSQQQRHSNSAEGSLESVRFTPQGALGRTDSLELAEQLSVPRDIARRVLEHSGGDIYLAFCNLIRLLAGHVNSPTSSSKHNSSFSYLGAGVDFKALSVPDSMFGVSRSHVLQIVNAAGGDIDLAQRQLFLEFQAHRKSLALENSLTNESGLQSPKHPSKDLSNCPICLEPCKMKDAMALSCSHNFCIECLRMHAAESVHAGNATVICPSGASVCKAELSQFEIQTLLDPRSFAILDRRALEQAVSLDTSMHLCATPDCTYIVAWGGPSDGLSVFNCPVCKHKRCIVCGIEPFHYGSLCPPPSIPSSAAVTSSGGTTSAPSQNLDDGLLMSMNIKRCKRCGQGVVKELGCDKVKCRCGYRFCYICLSENAQCACTPVSHGFIDNLTGRGDFSGLRNLQSPT